jgi:hypothetical protein
MLATLAIAQQLSLRTMTYQFLYDEITPSWVLVGGGTLSLVLVGVGIESPARVAVSLARYQAERISD